MSGSGGVIFSGYWTIDIKIKKILKPIANLPVFLTILQVSVAAAFTWRLYLIDRLFGDVAGCGNCLVIAAAVADAPFLTCWLIITWLGFTTNKLLTGRILRFLAVASLALYAADVYVLQTFFTRLYLTWVVTIGATPGIVLDHLLSTSLASFLALIFLFSLIFIALIQVPVPIPKRRNVLVLMLLVLSISVIGAGSNSVFYVHAWAVENVFLANQFSGVSNRYSDAYLEQAAEQMDSVPQCRKGQNQQRDLIVLILESWSAYQSKLWGGNNDWTPELDKIAKASLQPTTFVAGGFSTNHGLMSIIGGIPILSPLTSQFTRVAFEPAWGWPHTLPNQLAKGGYHTALLTTGDLNFLDKGKWFRHAGFQHIEGHEHPFYNDMTRAHFNSAPDEALFDRALQYWSRNTGTLSPLAIVIESVSTHGPYIHPISGEKSEEAVFHYLDNAVRAFFRGLHDQGFFTTGGVLVIVSDHRSMTVIGKQEFATYGAFAPALIPMMIYGESIDPATVNRLFHQSDIAPSLAMLLTSEACGYPGWVSLFEGNDDTKNRCVYHSSGKDFAQILVYCEHGNGIIELNGDQSEFIDENGLSPAQQQRLLQQVALFRDAAQKTSQEYLAKTPGE